MSATAPDFNVLGKGIYGFQDAARFIGAPARTLRRWVARRAEIYLGAGGSQPLWVSQLAPAGLDAISFKDLIELRFINAFRAAGISMSSIRHALAVMRSDSSASYPLTHLCVDAELWSGSDESVSAPGVRSRLGDGCHRAICDIVKSPALRQGLEVDTQGEVACWYPVPDSRLIVLDPHRRMGDAILTESGVPTVALEAAVTAEHGDESFVARIYHIRPCEVRAAVEFERRIRHS